jgi:hypothetical protein
MHRIAAALLALIFPVRQPALAEPAPPGEGLCSARVATRAAGLLLEPRFLALLEGRGCREGDVLHIAFDGPTNLALVVATLCRFDRPVHVDRAPEPEIACVFLGRARAMRP